MIRPVGSAGLLLLLLGGALAQQDSGEETSVSASEVVGREGMNLGESVPRQGVLGRPYAAERPGYGSSSWSKPTWSQGTWSKPTYSQPARSYSTWSQASWSDPTWSDPVEDVNDISELAARRSEVSGAGAARGSITRPQAAPKTPSAAGESVAQPLAPEPPPPPPPPPRELRSWGEWEQLGVGGQPPVGTRFGQLPPDAQKMELNGEPVYYVEGSFLRPEGDPPRSYVTVRAPVGAIVSALPVGCGRMQRADILYYVCGETWYIGWGDVYAVVDGPA